jgi:hypothetical protein
MKNHIRNAALDLAACALVGVLAAIWIIICI